MRHPVSYVPKLHFGRRWRDSRPFFLVDIDDNSVFVSFSSENNFSKEILLGSKDKYILDEYIRNGFISLYRGGRFVISRSLDEIPTPNLNSNSFNLILIRQFLKDSGYNINYLTSRKEICELLKIDLKSTKKKICKRLGIVYSPADRGWNSTEKRKVRLTNVRDDTHIIVFESISKTAREIGINSGETVYKYIRRLPIHYFGENFLLSFV